MNIFRLVRFMAGRALLDAGRAVLKTWDIARVDKWARRTIKEYRECV